MKKLKVILVSAVLFFCAVSVFSQKNNVSDSLSEKETLKVDSLQDDAQSRLLQQQKMQHMDSLIKIQLQKELQDAEGDKLKTQELEEKLNKIAENDSIRKAEQLQNIEKLKKSAIGYPVILVNDTLFTIYTKIGSFNSKDRASAISQKIKKLYDDPFYNPDSLTAVDTEYGYEYKYIKIIDGAIIEEY